MSRKTRKLMWAVPLMAVVAAIGALALFVAQTPNPALAHDPPGVVVNLTGEADGTNQINLSWDAPTTGGMVDSYRIDRSSDGNVWMTHKTGITATEYEDTMLDAGKPYYYRVFAVNSAGTGPVSQDYTVQTDAAAVPSEVLRLTARAVDQNQINLEWEAPAKIGGTPITKYSIHFASGTGTIPVAGTAPAATATDPDVIDVPVADGTTYEHKKLTAGTRYRYVVYAHNAIGNATVASNIAGATTAALVKPGPPTHVTAVQTGDRDFSLYWYAPTNTGGAPITGYKVEVQANGRGDYEATDHGTAAVSGVDATARTLSADATITIDADDGATTPVAITRVRFRVTSQTGDANASPSTLLESTGTVSGLMTLLDGTTGSPATQLARTVPSAPTFATGDADRNPKGNVELEWTAPAIDGDDTTTDGEAPGSIGGYRIDVSDDGVAWRPLINHTRKTSTKYEYVDEEKKVREYRIFAWHAQHLGPAQSDAVASALDTADVEDPGHVSSFTATAVGPTQIDLAWSKPASDGNAPIVRYQIDGVRAAADGTFAEFATVTTPANALPTASMSDGVVLAVVTTPGYSHMKLKAGETWQYRVLAITDDSSDTGNIRWSPPGTAETRKATTHQEDMPEAPEMLVAELAKNRNVGQPGVLLLWNAPDNPAGAELAGYRVQWMKDGGAWQTLKANTETTDTNYTHAVNLEADEMRGYRVAAISTNKKVSGWSNPAYIPVAAHDPGMPTNVTAEKVAAMPTSQIKVSWSAPASGVVDGYIIERRYGDMMAIPSDGYSGENGANRMHAFKNYKEWWETLNCKGMLAVAGSSADPAVDSDDKAMYCKHFANTAPTNMAFEGSTVSDATAMKIKELFMKRYVSDADGNTTTMFTGMMHTDMGLMASTEYTYRVRAIHGMKAGPWSAAAMAMTDPADTTLGAPTEIKFTVDDSDPGDQSVTVTWTNGANALSHLVLLFDTSDWTLAKPAATMQDSGDTTFSSVPAGSYIAVVVAYDANANVQLDLSGTITVAAGN